MIPVFLQPRSLLASAATRDVAEFVTELRYLPDGWWAVLTAAVVLLGLWAVVFMYRREGRVGATMGVRMFLAGLRSAVLLTLVVILAEPVSVRIIRKWVDSYTVLLVDSSSSMDLTDPYDSEGQLRVSRVLGSTTGSDRPPTETGTATSSDKESGSAQGVRRSELASVLLDRNERRLLRDLADRNRVKLYTFDSEPQLQGTLAAAHERTDEPTHAKGENAGAGPALLGVDALPTRFSATGATTNVERAVRRSVEALGSAPVAAVVVLSDGGFNDGASSQETARFARERGVPIFTVGIGDPSPPRNIRVAELIAPENAFKEDPFAITVRLAATGLDGQPLTVKLLEQNLTDASAARELESRTVNVGPGGALEPLTFQRRQEQVGRFAYSVEVPVLEGESVVDDNSKQATVNVIDSRTRVLLISGGPSWDYRFLSRLLQRDETVDVSCWLQSADLAAVRDGNTVIDHLPALAEELFEYDVILMLDPDKSEFDESWCRLVDTLVTEHGGGLLVSAARQESPSFFREPGFKALLDLLPVTFDPEADLILNQVGHYQLAPSAIEIPDAVLGHPVLRSGDDSSGSSRLNWRAIAEVYWHYPVLREKPAATVLMRHADRRMSNAYGGHVLAAVQFVGAGRSGFLAFDGTWRWRRHGVAAYDRFWIQLVRFLAEGKLLSGTKRGTLLLESDQYALGQAVTMSARLFDSRFRPLTQDRVLATCAVDGDRREFELLARRDRPGTYEGRFVPDRTGTYRVRIVLPGPSPAAEPVEISRDVRVSRPNIEILRPQMDRAKLATLAGESKGGRYLEVDEVDHVAGLIPDLHEEIPIRSRPTSLWDNGIVLTFLLVLLSVEWFVRKWNRLL